MFYFAVVDTDLGGRLEEFTSEAPWYLWVLISLTVMLTIKAAYSEHAFWLIPIYLFLCLFSASFIQSLDAASTLARWWLIGCFCVTAIYRSSNPGVVCKMLGFYWAYGIMSNIWSPNFKEGIQVSTLAFLLTMIGSHGISGMLPNVKRIKKLFRCLALLSLVFIVTSIPGLAGISGSRFSGGMQDASPLFVITGGFFLPILLWAFISSTGKLKVLHGCAFLVISVLLLLSAQRTGFFAGITACIPIVLQTTFKALRNTVFILLSAVVVGAIGINSLPEQKEFLIKRYMKVSENGDFVISTDTTGRSQIWESALGKIKKQAILGSGAAAHKKSGIGGFHNAYLQEWYNGGILGIILFFGASLVGLRKSFRLVLNRCLSNSDRQLCRMLLGLMFFLLIVSFFEAKLASPSNIMIFMMVLVGVAINRFERSAVKVLRHKSAPIIRRAVQV